MSTQSVSRPTKKTRLISPQQGQSLTQSAPADVLSRPSSSRLGEVYKTAEFRTDWANDVKFHVSRNLLHLRRYRGISQKTLGNLTGTSQSAIARIENEQENITLDTLERLVNGLDGQFYVSIHPPEYAPLVARPWWDRVASPHSINVLGVATWQTDRTVQGIVGFEMVDTLPRIPGALLPEAQTTNIF